MKWIQIKYSTIGWMGEKIPQTVEYAVNKYGEGLFLRMPDGTWKQLQGTGQFSADSPRTLMRKLRRSWNGLFTDIRMVRGSAVGWD